MTFYDLAYKTLTPLVTKDPTNVEWRSGLALNYFGVGQTKMSLGNTSDALSDFREASHILDDLILQSPHNLYLIGYLMPIHKQIGAILLGQRDYNGALAVYEKSRKISEELAETDPENTEVRSWGASSVEKIGQLKGRQGDHAAELEALRIARYGRTWLPSTQTIWSFGALSFKILTKWAIHCLRKGILMKRRLCTLVFRSR